MIDTRPQCPRCGAPRLPNAPAGLCPRCLLGNGLPSGSQTLSRSLSRFPSRTSGILSTLHESVGPVPRVLLRDDLEDGEPPALSCSERMPLSAGTEGRYQLLGEIARGGMGVVLKGRDVDVGRDVAVKVLLEKHRGKPEMIRRFAEEAQIAGQLQHPGIVPVYELGRLPDGRLYIAMKLIRGHTMAALLDNRSNPADDLPRLLSAFEQVCQAMAYAHSRGVIHRDLKPSNIMIGSFGEIQVMDWGLGKVIGRGGIDDEQRSRLEDSPESSPVRTLRSGSTADDSRTGSVLGTPSYMAPEQARGQLDTLDERVDVFGLGAILCEILTGKPPYSAPSGIEIVRQAERADLTKAMARLDGCGAEADLVALAKSCLAPAPRDRPRDAGAVVLALSAHLAGVRQRLQTAELARARAESRAVEERKRRLLTAGLAASLLALLALGAGGGAWVTHQRAIRAEMAAREGTRALHETSLLLGKARAATEGDLTAWAEASQASRRAETMLSRPELGLDLRDRIRDLSETVALERKQAEARSKDRRMVDRLVAIHADIALPNGWGKADHAYEAAFREYGIDLERLAPAEAGALVAGSPIAVELVNALDQWTFLHRGKPPHGPRSRARLLSEVAHTADPDPWRCRLRWALALPPSEAEIARDTFEDLAASAPGDVRYRESLSRLAFALRVLGDHDRAIALLRRVQRAHPDDFWINYDLAASLQRAGRPNEAVRFYSVAVAIRPQSGIALDNLEKTLREAGRLEEAAAYARDSKHEPVPPAPPATTTEPHETRQEPTAHGFPRSAELTDCSEPDLTPCLCAEHPAAWAG